MNDDEYFLGKKSKTKSNSGNKINTDKNLLISKGNILTQISLDDFFTAKVKKQEKVKFSENRQIEPKDSEEHPITKNLCLHSESNKKSIIICSWNVNGLRGVLADGSLENFIKKEEPDILCLNETKLNNTNSNIDNLINPMLNNFHKYFNNCKIRSGYSGVSIFSKINPISVKYGIDDITHDQEGRVIILEFDTYFLIAVYVPNSGQKLKRLEYRVKEWDKVFFQFVEKMKSIKDVIVCGDLNVAHNDIDIFSPKGHQKYAGFTLEERNNFTKFLKAGYVDTFRYLYPTSNKFSFFSDRYGKMNLINNKGWRLDYFVINNESVNRMIDSQIMNEYDASDHSPIKLEWKI